MPYLAPAQQGLAAGRLAYAADRPDADSPASPPPHRPIRHSPWNAPAGCAAATKTPRPPPPGPP
ncbi:hypothetical protein ACFQU2_36415 [Siccirubricoccus deserti]